MAGKRKWKVAVVALLVVAGGVFFSTCKPSQPSISISFVGFTNGPRGQLQANFAISRHETPSPELMYRYLIRGDGCDEGALLETLYPFPFHLYVTMDISECDQHFRLEVLVVSSTWKYRLASSGVFQSTLLSKLVPSSWRHPGICVYTSQWILNPAFTTNQPAPPPP